MNPQQLSPYKPWFWLAPLLICLGLIFNVSNVLADTDSDADGIEDASDCNPTDPRIAFAQKYYFDLDGDLSGDSNNPATICSISPFPGTVLWNGDPDDHDPTHRAPVQAKGSRRLSVNFEDSAADGSWRPDLAKEIGADSTTLHLLWNQIETAPGQYNGPQAALLDVVVSAYAKQGFSINLTISPISQLYLTVPPDLAAGLQSGALSLESPEVIARFNAFLDFVHGKLSTLPIPVLQIGHEVDRYLEVNPDINFWRHYAIFFSAAQSHARQLWGSDLSVGITATSNGIVTKPAKLLMASLNQLSDHISVTFSPHSSTFEAIDPESVRLQVQTLIEAAYPKPLMFQSVTAPSGVKAHSSTTLQAQFFEAFFSVWDEYAGFVPFASFARLYDWPEFRAANEALSPQVAAGNALATATSFLKSLGFRDQATGNSKAAYDRIRMLAMERGWQESLTNTNRTTLVGFTPALYDRIGVSIDDTVLNNVMKQIGNAGDMALLQFDNGVPWTEAYTDQGAGPLPYSANLRDTWEKYRAAQPPGTRLAIALNPIGVPRSQLAPYWGIGEDFYLNDKYEPVGTGVIRDFENRLLPPQWRNRKLDDPAVKIAFTNYAKRAIQFFSPDYLIIGIEANLALDPDPAAYSRFVALQRYVYEALKADPATAHIPVIVSFTAEHFMLDELGTHYLLDGIANPEGLRQQHLDAMAASVPYLDMVGFSVYPLKTRFGTFRTPASMFDHLMKAIRSVTSKPVAITETGFPANGFTVKNQIFQGSPEKQEQYYKLVFDEAEKYKFEFVVSYTPFDMTPFMDRLRAGAAQKPPTVSPDLVEFFKYFEFMGLFQLNAPPRPAGNLVSNFVTLPLVIAENKIPTIQIQSPSGKLTSSIGVNADGKLFYAVDLNGRQVIYPSPLGQIVDGSNLGEKVTNIALSNPVEMDETYETRGVHKTARNHYIGATLSVRRTPVADRTVNIEFRVYDDGVAYRYIVPGQGLRSINGEISAWVLPDSSKVWHQVNTENYEANYRGTTLGLFNDDIGGPVTAEIPSGGYLLITEAALKHYSGLTYHANLASRMLQGTFLDNNSWSLSGGSPSPWRVVLATETLDELVNSDMVANLNDPPETDMFPDGANTEWIKPGRAVWSWWSNNASGFSFDIQHQYVDFAHQLRTEYQVIDAGWETGFPSNGQDAFQRLSALSSYAKVQWRDVGLWVWKYWYELKDPEARNTFFAKVADAGGVGVKIDNVYGYQSESVDNVELQEAILKDAAAHHLMINFHGVGKSTGLYRTYPNEISHEGLMGLELNGLAWDKGLFVTPEHNAALPFVRFVVGPGDYTPVTLDPRKIGKTTFTHQLATAGIFTSPLQHWADNPEVILQQPIAVELLRTIPVQWEETRVLPPSEIGKLALFARRSAGRWYLFAINGDAVNPIQLKSVKLDFLGPGQWNAKSITDANRTQLAEGSLTQLTSASTLDIPMLSGGGFVTVFSPAAVVSKPVKQGFSSIAPAFTREGWQQGYSILRDHADIVSHSLQEGIPWPEALLSSDPSTFSEHLLSYWNLIKSANEAVIPTIPRYLMLNPIETISYAKLAPYLGERDYMPLPPPWDSYDFNHPNVKKAYTNYAIAAIEFFKPTYVAIGIEANVLLAHRPDKWAAYKELNEYVYQALKVRYPTLTVFTSVQYEQMLGLFIESEQLAASVKDWYPNVLQNEVMELMKNSDLFAISTYPFMVQNNIMIGPSSRLDADYYDRAFELAKLAGKRFAVEQSGYITQDLFSEAENVTLPGSVSRQNDFIERLLNDTHVNNTEFVINFVAQDYGLNYGNLRTTLTWAYTGMFNENSTPKPALGIWDAYRGNR